MSKTPQQYFDEPVFILGLPRSGTSMVTGIMQLCGAWLGETVPGGGVENPKGFFENIFLREGVNKKILADSGFDPLGIGPLPFFDQLPKVNGLKQTILDYLKHAQYEFDRPWAFKEPKLTLLWPIYYQNFPNARWIIVNRDLDEVVNSCIRTSFMKKHSTDRDFWLNWAEAYQLRLDALKQTSAPWRQIETGPMIRGELDAIADLIQWSGLQWDEQKAREFISPDYWHANSA